MILLIYNQKMCREILLPNLRDSDYAISISGKAYGLRQDIRLLLEITGVTWKIKADETYQLRKSGIFCENVVLEEHEKLVIRTKRGDDDDKIRLNQRKPSKYKGLSRFGPEKNLQRINKFMKERPIFYKNLIQMKENIRFYLRCFYCITKVMILQFNSENRTELARNG